MKQWPKCARKYCVKCDAGLARTPILADSAQRFRTRFRVSAVLLRSPFSVLNSDDRQPPMTQHPPPDNLTARRIVAAAESGKYKNMACIARKLGVSRERVRQVLNATGHSNFGPRHVRLQ